MIVWATGHPTINPKVESVVSVIVSQKRNKIFFFTKNLLRHKAQTDKAVQNVDIKLVKTEYKGRNDGN